MGRYADLLNYSFANMRALVIISVFTIALLTGCDPGGLRRVQLRLPQGPRDGSTIEVAQQDLQEALGILETVVVPFGFKAMPAESDDNYIRVYMLSRPPVTVEGRSSSRDVPIRVSKTPTGIEVAFGHFGLLGSTPEPAVRAFKDTRTAFVKRFGSKHVKTKTFGSANPQAGANGRQPLSSETNRTSAAAAARRSP